MPLQRSRSVHAARPLTVKLFTERSMACHMSQLHTMGYNFHTYDGVATAAWVSVDKLLSARMYYGAGLVSLSRRRLCRR
jgi:hypothetical protein